MKKVYTLMAIVAFFSSAAYSQCTIDANAQTTPGISPSPDSLPCVVRSTAFDQTLQVQCPTTFDSTVNFAGTNYTLTVTVDSMELDSIINLPEGLTWSKNPSRLNGGQNGCLNMTGTTTAPTGRYNLLWYGTIWATLPSPIPAPYNKQTYTGVLNQISGFDYYLDVINQGDACHTVAGIRDFNKDLNVIMQVFPNPTSGKFQINLNAGSRINGQIVIMDMTGREVYTKNIDLLGLYSTSVDMTQFSKGLYVLQLRTAQGVASRRISVE